MHFHYAEPGSVTLFGVLFVVALGTFWWLARRNATFVGIQPSHIDLLLPVSILFGIAGGLLLSLFMPADQLLAGEALQVDVRIRLFGMVASGAVAVFFYSRLNKLSFRSLLDVLALPTIAGLAIHRIGCFYAGCCWGDISVRDGWLTSIASTGIGMQIQTLPWLAGEWVWTGVQYDPGTYPYEQQLALGLITADALKSMPVHPVQLYEAALLVIAFLILRRMPITASRPGRIALATIITYAAIRFVLEYLRADGVLALGNLTITQLQCFVLAVFATAVLWAMRADRSLLRATMR